MNRLKRIIFAVVATTVIAYSASSFAASYKDEAKQAIEKGEYSTAIIQLKNHLKLEPKDADARLLLGLSYLKADSIKPAEKELHLAYQLEPENENIILNYSNILLLLGKYKKADKLLEVKFTDTEYDNKRMAYRALSLLGQNKLADAKQLFLNLSNKTRQADVYLGLAKIALLESEYYVAQKWLDKATKIEPESTEVAELGARIDIANQQYDKALKIYNKLINENSNKLSFYLMRAAIQMRLKNMAEVEKDLQIVLKKVKNQPQANYMLAQVKLFEKKYEESILAAQKVVNVIPRHYSSMLILGIANLGLENYNQADKYLTQYLSADPGNLVVQNILANTYLAQKKAGQALLILEAIDIEKINKNADILMTMGSAYLLTGELQKGINALGKARSLQPDSGEIQRKLISGQLKAGEVDKAIASMEEIVNSKKADQKTGYLLIVTYIQQKQVHKAEKMIADLIKENPQEPALYNMTAVVAKLKGKNQQAIKAYEQAIQLNKNFIPAYMGLAEIASSKKDWGSAKRYYSKVLQIDPKYIKAYRYLAAIAEQQNQPQEVEKILKTALEQTRGNINSQVVAATFLRKWYVKQKTPEKIMPIARELNGQYPNNSGTLSVLATAQIANKKYEEGTNTLRKLINKDGTDVTHRLLLVALLARKQGNESEVLGVIDSLVGVMPKDPKPIVFKSAFLIKNKQYQQALNVADYAKEQFPELPLGDQIKADVYRLQHKLDKALSSYYAAYKIQADTKTLFIIADLLAYQGKEQEALTLLKSELKNKDKNTDILFKIANIYQKNKQYNQSIPFYSKILEVKPDNLVIMNNLAWAYIQENNPKAIVFAEKAYKKAPKSATIVDTYGYIELRQGDMNKGIQLLEDALKLSPDAYGIKFHLAEAYSFKGDKKRARKLLSLLVNVEDNFPEKEQAQALLRKL